MQLTSFNTVVVKKVYADSISKDTSKKKKKTVTLLFKFSWHCFRFVFHPIIFSDLN